MSWEKIGATVVAKPVAHSSGIYLRVPKRVARAYELYTAEEVEFTLDRARRREKDEDLHTSAEVCKEEEEGGR
jgi:hypothetical protein